MKGGMIILLMTVLLVQVKRATQHLLEQLFNHVSNMSQLETDNLLGEDTDLMQRRAATRQVGLVEFGTL